MALQTDPITGRPKVVQDAKAEDRYKRAKDAGMSEERAQQYRNYQSTNYVEDTFWDKMANFFGAKTGREKETERLRAEEDAFFNNLLNADYEEKYNSAQQQSDRMRDAGINPNLSDSPVPAGDASQIDDSTLGGVAGEGQLQNIAAATGPMDAVQRLLDIGVGVASFAAGGVDVAQALTQLDLDEVNSIFDITSKGLDVGTSIPGLGQFLGTQDIGNVTHYRFSDPVAGEYLTDDPVGRFNQTYGHNLRTSRGRRVASQAIRGMFGIAGDARRAGYKKQSVQDTKDTIQAGSAISGLVDDSKLSIRDRAVYRDFASSETFTKYQALMRQAFQSELEYKANEMKFSSDFYEQMNKMRLDGKSPAEIKAASEAYQLEKKARADAFQSGVYQSITSYVQQLSELAAQGDGAAQTMLYFLMSPGISGLYGASGNGFELVTGGTPYGAIKDLGSGIADLVKMFNPKTLAKGSDKMTKPVSKKKAEKEVKSGGWSERKPAN